MRLIVCWASWLWLLKKKKSEDPVEPRVWAQEDSGFGDLSKGHRYVGNLQELRNRIREVSQGLVKQGLHNKFLDAAMRERRSGELGATQGPGGRASTVCPE